MADQIRMNDAAKEELALALLLWKDFKTQDNPGPGVDIKIATDMFTFAKLLGVQAELEALIPKLPRLRIVPFNP